ncbi:hypothetical protein B0T24DRAFT_517229 [Lasiosphaeria ovina]|uniref:F-box domain-containing protein n=1 Tax=Lasiosphaeria ovina TaxID=92902 RepID=A0AAE0NIL3_9PEZI|nr:hypothetical protein B0T24DRAFT_517229 [Lasiosphaeria ovina]
MAQKFCLVAPRHKMAMPRGGRLEDMLFDGSASSIVRLLAVPIRPKETLVPLVDLPHTTVFSPVAAATTSTNITKSKKRKADSKAEPSPCHKRRMLNSGRSMAIARARTMRRTRDPPTFIGLPTELLRIVFEKIESIEDVVCLALTDRFMWHVGLEYLHKHNALFLGRWANKNIVFAGEGCQPNDYPPNLFSAKELDQLRGEKYISPWFKDIPGVRGAPFKLHHFVYSSVSTIEGDTSLYIDHSADLIRHVNQVMGLTAGKDVPLALLFARMEIGVSDGDYYPTDEPWILRNLTTRQFVRADALAVRPEVIRGPKIGIIGFGEVVMARTCWTTAPVTGVAGSTTIPLRGVWAGHRFDITTRDRHEDRRKDADQWTDVSDEVAAEMARLWEGKFGPDWRKTCFDAWLEKNSQNIDLKRSLGMMFGKTTV